MTGLTVMAAAVKGDNAARRLIGRRPTDSTSPSSTLIAHHLARYEHVDLEGPPYLAVALLQSTWPSAAVPTLLGAIICSGQQHEELCTSHGASTQKQSLPLVLYQYLHKDAAVLSMPHL